MDILKKLFQNNHVEINNKEDKSNENQLIKETAVLENKVFKEILKNKGKENQTIEESCDQVLDAMRQLEELKLEYHAVTSYLTDIQKIDENQAILVDGGITNPAILAKVMDPHKICCIKICDNLCIRIWEDDEERQPMKKMIFQLPSPKDKWSKFLNTNILMNQQIEAECKENDIRIFFRQDETTVDEMVNEISALFFKK